MKGRPSPFLAPDAAGLGLILHDAHGQVVDANEAAASILELARDALIGPHAEFPYWHLDGELCLDGLAGGHPPLPRTHSNGDVISVRTRSGNLRHLKVGVDACRQAGPARLMVSFVDLTAELCCPSRIATPAGQTSSACHKSHAYRMALDHHALVVITDRAGRITHANQPFCRVSGYERAELIGQTHALFNAGHHPADFFAGMWSVIKNGQTWHGQICNRRRSGDLIWLDTTIVPFRDVAGKIDGYISIRHDITARKQAETIVEQANANSQHAGKLLCEIVKLQAKRDALTGLRSRSALLERLAAVMRASRGKRPRTGAVALIDMDRLKDINAAFGHDAGDELLRVFGRRLDDGLRATDIVARLGSDEFAIVLPRMRTEAEVLQLTDRLTDELRQPHMIGTHRIDPDFSMGVAFFPQDGGTPGELIKNAYTALHQAKATESGKIGFYSAALKSRLEHHQEIVDALREAVQRDEIEIALQPQVAFSTGQIAGFEALARWQWQGRNVPPQEFIAIAEETGLIEALGYNVLNKALAALDTMIREGHEPGRMAVNVAAAQLKRPDFIKTLKEALCRHDTPPHRLEIEVTENVLLERSAHLVAETLQSLHDLGVRVALDDFGTGYASLAHLKSHPVDRLKIDRSFVSGIPEDANDTVIVRTVIGLAHNLSMDVVAEGIETADQLSYLADQHCDVGQGYHFGRPASLEQTLALLSDLTCKRQKAG